MPSNNDPRLVGIESVKPYEVMESTTLYTIIPPPMLVEDIIPKGTITGVTSLPGTGKTWLAFEMARALSTQTPFLGRFATERGSVLFVGSDASIFDYAQQWRRLTQQQWGELIADENSPVDYINPLDGNVRFLIQSDFLFENLDSVRRIIATSRKFEWGPEYEVESDQPGLFGPTMTTHRNVGFSLIIFDTLSKMTRANQNDNTEMEEVFRNLRLIAEQTKAAIILLHHNGKRNEFNSGEDWRGAMSQIGSLDNWFQLTPARNDKELIRVTVKKFRGVTPAEFSYEMKVSEALTASLMFTERVTVEEEAKEDEIKESAIDWLRKDAAKDAWWSGRQIADALWGEKFGELWGNKNKASFILEVKRKLDNESAHTRARVLKVGGGRGSVEEKKYKAPPEVVQAEGADSDISDK